MNRMHRPGLMALLIALPVLVGLSVWAQPKEPTPSAGPRIAVVNIQKIFEGLDEHEDIETEIKGLGEQIKKALADKEKQIKDLEKALQVGVHKRGSDQHIRATDELALKRLELETIRKYGQIKTSRQTTRRLVELYQTTLKAIDKIAAEKGYDLVLHQLDRSNIKGSTPRQISDRLDLHQVLYASARIDLTEYIKNVLNNQYNNAKNKSEKP
ncbi:MAG: OmpH family outer membrane protein [Phycisphaeraceae bacterium]|nr:OmpH family outer membrane protein [Phycisphaeraceae bacterium]